MRWHRLGAGVVGIGLLLSGCASTRPAEAPKPRAAIRSVAMVPIAEPGMYSLGRRGGLTAMFGLAGQLVEGHDTALKSTAFGRRMIELKPAVGAELARVLDEQLSSAGYTTSVMADVAAAGPNPDEFDYAKLKTDADAILHVWVIDAGVYSHASSLSYKPRLNVGMRLVSTRDSEELLYQYIYYGADARTLSDETIPADPKYAYLTFEALRERAD